jgi:hypothetical protein
LPLMSRKHTLKHYQGVWIKKLDEKETKSNPGCLTILMHLFLWAGCIYTAGVLSKASIVDEYYLLKLSAGAATVITIFFLALYRTGTPILTWPVVVAAVYGFLGLYDMKADAAAGKHVVVAVQATGTLKSIKTHDITYEAYVVLPNEPGGDRVYKLIIPENLYAAIGGGAKLRLTVKPGALGARWVSDVTLL